MKIFTSFLVLILSVAGFAQNHPLFVSSGAKSLGLANTYVNQGDLWSNFNNQAGLSQVEDLTFGVFHPELQYQWLPILCDYPIRSYHA